MGIAYAVLLVAGFYLLVSRHTTPLVAALLSASLACFPDFFACASSFMTDIPYAAYFVWFLLAHDLLLGQAQREVGRGIALWIFWGTSFLLAALTRPFILIAIPVFFLQWVFAAERSRTLYRRCAICSTSLAVLSLLLIAVLGDNRFRTIEQTSLREVFVLHEYGRFNVQAMLLSLLSTGFVALPALLLSAETRRMRPSLVEGFVATMGLVVGTYYWHRGMLASVLPIANPGVSKLVTLMQVLGASIGWVVVYRLLRASVSGSRSGGVEPVLAAVIVAQFAAMPIMQHPLLRHAMPAFVALVVLIAIVEVRFTRPIAAFAAVCIALMISSNALMTRHSAKLDETAWQVSEELLKSGVPLRQIDGGWGWFCYYHLHPGRPDTQGYRARYYELRDHARYSVGNRPPASGEIALREVDVPAPLIGPPKHVFALDRISTNSSTTLRGGSDR
jgi:hypothetical protein